jgi:hypothetical protein
VTAPVGLLSWCVLVGTAAAAQNGVTLPASQTADSSLVRFIAQARAGTAKYRDQHAAIVDGYRLIGPDSPAMGQHWVEPSLLVEGRLDPRRPQILEYITVAGQPVLAGVTYAIPLAPGDEPPDAPLGRAAWHYHSGTVDEESLPLAHAAGHGRAELRVAVLHAWIWIENPAGPFASDNWALPFVRVGMAVPEHCALPAAKALALLTGGDVYLTATLRAVGQPDSADAATMQGIIAGYRQRAAMWRSSTAGRAPREQDLSDLADLWARMWGEIQSGVSPAVSARLATLHHEP